MTKEIPAPKFNLFERVVITGDGGRSKDCHGKEGTIIGLESSAVRRNPALSDQWIYVVQLPSLPACKSFVQSDLESVGCFDPESAHLGRRAEISFDLVPEEDNDWIEGSYRLPGEFWKVVIFQRDDIPELEFRQGSWQKCTQWERDVAGIVILFPKKMRMGREDMLHAMSQAFGCNDWVEVVGPDSMMLR